MRTQLVPRSRCFTAPTKAQPIAKKDLEEFLICLVEHINQSGDLTREVLEKKFGDVGKRFDEVLKGQREIKALVERAIAEILTNREHIHDVKRLVIDAQSNDIPWLFVMLPDAAVKKRRFKYLTMDSTTWLARAMRVHLICNGPDGQSPHFLHETADELVKFFPGYEFNIPRKERKMFGLAIKIAVGAACLTLSILTAGAAVPALAAAIGLSSTETLSKEAQNQVAAEVNKRVFEQIVTTVAKDMDATETVDTGRDTKSTDDWPDLNKLKQEMYGSAVLHDVPFVSVTLLHLPQDQKSLTGLCRVDESDGWHAVGQR